MNTSPSSEAHPGTPDRGTFRALRHPGYAWFAGGALITNVAVWMQRITQDWVVIEYTGSALAVGITTALQFLPILILGPFFGTLADRWPKRPQLVVAGSLIALAAVALGVVIVTGTVTQWHIYGTALLLGVGAAADAPVRQAFVRELVPDRNLTNAIGLNAASFHTARIIGPVAAGFLIAWLGPGVAFISVGVLVLTGLSFLAASRPLRHFSESESETLMPAVSSDAALGAALRQPSRPGSLTEAVRFLRTQPELIVVMVLAAVVCAFALNFQVTITLMATTVFGLNAAEFGALTTVMAVGSIIGALFAARRVESTVRLVLGAALCLGVLYAIAGYAPNLGLFALAIFPIGIISNTFMTSSNALVQVRIDGRMQGRVMAIYMAVVASLTPIGAPLIGLIAEIADARLSLLLAGVVCFVATVAAGALLSTRRLGPTGPLTQSP